MFRILSGVMSTIGLILFVIWILVPTDQNQRLERACKPVQWVGGLGVSVVDVVHHPWAHSVQSAVDHTDYTCRYALWNMFFKKDYQQWELEKQYKQYQEENSYK